MPLPLALMMAPAAIQAGTGLYQTIQGMDAASKLRKPDENLLNRQVSMGEENIIEALGREQAAMQQARRGFSPEQEAALRQQLQSAFSTQGAAIRGMGGSRGQAMSNQANLALQQGNALTGLAAQDAAMQMQRQQYANQLGTQTAAYRGQLGSMLLNRYGIQDMQYGKEAAGAAAMQGAGLQNIAGGAKSAIGGIADYKKLQATNKKADTFEAGAGYNANTTGSSAAGQNAAVAGAGAAAGASFFQQPQSSGFPAATMGDVNSPTYIAPYTGAPQYGSGPMWAGQPQAPTYQSAYDPYGWQNFEDGGKIPSGDSEGGLMETIRNLISIATDEHDKHIQRMANGGEVDGGPVTEVATEQTTIRPIGTGAYSSKLYPAEAYYTNPAVANAIRSFTPQTLSEAELQVMRQTYPNLSASSFQDQRGMNYFLDEQGNIIGMQHSSGQAVPYVYADSPDMITEGQFVTDYTDPIEADKSQGGTGFWKHMGNKYKVSSEAVYRADPNKFNLEEEYAAYMANPNIQLAVNQQGGQLTPREGNIVYLNQGEIGGGTTGVARVVQVPIDGNTGYYGGGGPNVDMGAFGLQEQPIPRLNGGKIFSYAKGGKTKEPQWSNDARNYPGYYAQPDGSGSTVLTGYTSMGDKFGVYPHIRNINGKLVELDADAAFNMARENNDFAMFDTEAEAQAYSNYLHNRDAKGMRMKVPDVYVNNDIAEKIKMGLIVPSYAKGGKIPTFAKGGPIPTKLEIMTIGIGVPKDKMMQQKHEGFRGGKTEGEVKEAITAKVVDKESGEMKQPVELHGQERVFDAETTTKMEELAKAEDFEALGRLVAETIAMQDERDAKITDTEGMEEEGEMEIEEEVE